MQSRDLLLVAARCSQKPEEQRYVLERVAERADYVGCSDPALSPCRFNPGAACFCARDATRRVTLRDKTANQIERTAPAANYQNSH